jgi:hypothetical protein
MIAQIGASKKNITIRKNNSSHYATALVIAPVTGQETDALASSPTAPFTGVHSAITALQVYVGLNALVDEPFGFTITVATVPSNG